MKSIKELVEKYNRPGPRYTSYPPVPYWRNCPTSEQWIEHVKQSYDPLVGVDLYIHVPFCERLCYYCGCFRTITKNHDVETPFITAIIKEWTILQNKLGFTPLVNSIHFGGGTPTFLSSVNLDFLLSHLLKNKSANFTGSVEVDPRTCQAEHLDIFKFDGFQRISMGIQDFDREVQLAINREQSFELVKKLTDEIRAREFKSINFDLIYGLPKQTEQSVKETIKAVSSLRPDMIAFYSYAHLPEKIKNQKLIKSEDLPSAQLKKSLYEVGKAELIKHGYRDIGMDHFALTDNYLFKAFESKKLKRNFMGFTDQKSGLMIGLGPSSISESKFSFVQNKKDIQNYYKTIEAGELPIETGHTQDSEDQIAGQIIHDLMCTGEFNYQGETADVLKDLASFLEDGLLTRQGTHYKVTELGKGFVRNVAMTFDHHLRAQKQETRFSQTV